MAAAPPRVGGDTKMTESPRMKTISMFRRYVYNKK